ncbi:MAG: ATP-binding protein [Polyangiaceae bacterium]
MKKKKEKAGPGSPLRLRAEERLAAQGEEEILGPPPEAVRLVHELRVHEIELEMQNEELRNARAELEASLARYTEIFDFAPIGYVTLDGQDTIREVNLAAARLLGRPRQRLEGALFRHFVDVGSRAAYQDFISRVARTTDEARPHEVIEVWLSGQGDEAICARLSAVGVGGTALLAIEDITAQKRAEAELADVSRRKDAFLATLSHELRNPLAPIRNSIAILKRQGSHGDRAARAVATLDRQTRHLSRITGDLLDTTRIASGKIELQRERVDLCALTRQTVDDHLSDFLARGIELACSVDPGEICTEADPTRVVQALGNLLVNAAKFTPEGGRVEVSLRREGAHSVIAVRDTGQGIAPEARARLFEPFYQGGQELDRRAGGLGLGLLIAKNLVELHGGTIDVSSEGAGKGSVFTIRLPIIETGARLSNREEEPVPPRRVLVIEDNVDGADALRDLLELSGHEVHVAHSGPRGVELARQHKPDIVLCDIGLPRMDGYEVARSMRADPELQGIYLVALSGYSSAEDRRRALAAGFNRHVAKPPTLPQLEEALRACRGTPLFLHSH